MKILLVDDSRVARTSLKKALKSGLIDVEFIEADDGESGWAAIGTHNPDLIFTDWYMERMDGLEFIQKLRAAKYTKKICMMTSETNSAKHQEALGCGADYILTKPLKPNELAKALEQLLG